MKLLLLLVLALALGAPSAAEDFQCKNDAGCSARITVDGEVEEVVFRKNDLVSTESGWVVTPDDGWEKIKTRTRQSGRTPPLLGFLYVGGGSSVFYGLVDGVPHCPGCWASRTPLTISLIGL